MNASVTIEDIRSAAEVIRDDVIRTPLIAAPRLSAQAQATVMLKLENLQHTGSFKDRGALNKLSRLSPEQRRAGVVAASAGNHAQGVAFHAQRLGIPATIVMPSATPFNKVQRTEAYGAKVVLTGDDLTQAAAHAEELAAKGLALVHPYDDPLIIAGQGTIGLELLEAAPDLDCLVVPIGGGGLISGIAIAAKAVKPEIEILGAEADLYPSMKQALAGQASTSGGSTIAEGIAVKQPGTLTRAIIERLVSDIIVVSEAAIERTVHQLISVQKLVVEGAGAAGVAAILAERERFAGKRVATVICGGNIDDRLLASVLMRGLVREGRLVRLRIAITDAPGTLATVARLVGDAGANIVEVYHHRLFSDVPVKMADIDIVVETRDLGHVQEVKQRLEGAGFPTELMGTIE